MRAQGWVVLVVLVIWVHMGELDEMTGWENSLELINVFRRSHSLTGISHKTGPEMEKGREKNNDEAM